MRVIAGIRKGHGLKAPSGLDVRPTEGRVKESIFSILGPIPTDAVVLDAFAGTGAIGIEFLSRGAKKCYFTDKSNESISFIKENVDHTKFEDQSSINRADANVFIRKAFTKGIKFDYIYIDPPFEQLDLVTKTMNSILEYDILSKNALILIEHVGDIEVDEKFTLKDKRKYGGKHISFYILESEGIN